MLSNLWNKVLAGLAALMAVALAVLKFKLGRAEARTEDAEDRAEEAEEVAQGYEAADATRTKAEAAVQEVRRKAKAQPKPDVKARRDLESGW